MSFGRLLLASMVLTALLPVLAVTLVTLAITRQTQTSASGETSSAAARPTRAQDDETVRQQVVSAALGLSALAALTAFLAGRALYAPIRRLRSDVDIVAGMNPRYRLRPPELSDLAAIASGVNALAERAERAVVSSHEELAAATRELTAEKDLLASVVFALSDGVIVCNQRLEIVLSNAAARRLLWSPAHPVRRGECIYSYLDPVPTGSLVDALELRTGEQRVGCGAITLPSSAIVQVSATVAGSDILGYHYVFFLRDLTPPVGREQRPDRFGSELVPDAVGHQVLALLGRDGFYHPRPPASGLTPIHGGARLRDLSFVVFDLETTGLEPELGDEILSIGAVRVRRGQVVYEDHFQSLLCPTRPIPPPSTRIHGLTDAMVAGHPPLAEVLPHFVEFAGSSLPVAHVASFDLAFLNPRLEQLGQPPLGRGVVLDTLLLTYSLFPDWQDFNLEAIASRLGVEVIGRHTSLGDALVTAEIFLRLLSVLEQRGIETVDDALRLQGGDAVRKVVRAVRARLARG